MLRLHNCSKNRIAKHLINLRTAPDNKVQYSTNYTFLIVIHFNIENKIILLVHTLATILDYLSLVIDPDEISGRSRLSNASQHL